MDWLDPLRDLCWPHQAKLLSERLPSISLRIDRQEPARGNAFFPAPTYTSDIRADDHKVGWINYAINPLGDRLYVNKIEIEPAHQKQGFGLATLWKIHQEHNLPIVPVYIYGHAKPFWTLARRQLQAAGAIIEPEMRLAELDLEKQRWEHLIPELEHLAMIRAIEASPEWPAIQAAQAAREMSEFVDSRGEERRIAQLRSLLPLKIYESVV